MNNLKKYTRQIMAVILSFSMLVTWVPLNPNSYAAANDFSKISQNESFAEKHPFLIKTLKYFGVLCGTLAATTVLYYSCGFVLDKIDPSRVENRKIRNQAKKQLKKINNQILRCGDTSEENIKATASRMKDLKDIRSSLVKSLKNSDDDYTSVKNTILGITGIGGVATAVKFSMDIVNSFGEFSKSVLNISNLRWSGSNFINMYKETSEILKLPPGGIEKQEAIKYFDVLFRDFYGQDQATDALKSHLYDIVVAKDQAKWHGEKYSKCDLIYLYGPSGVGKSFIAKRLPRALLSSGEPLIMSSSDVDKEKKESVVCQLFNSEPQNLDKVVLTKPLVKYLKNNPGGVVIFEEYDKVCTPALDEVFRGAMEQGTINIDGEKTDCSGTTFIFTSNEDDVSMEGFEQNSEEKPDKEKSRDECTRVWHSKSFLNRIKKVKFKSLSIEAYCSIIKSHFDLIAGYWFDSRNGNVKLTLDDKTIEQMAKRVQKINQGARPIDLWIIPSIQMELGSKMKQAPSYNFYDKKNLTVEYDPEKNTLSLKIM